MSRRRERFEYDDLDAEFEKQFRKKDHSYYKTGLVLGLGAVALGLALRPGEFDTSLYIAQISSSVTNYISSIEFPKIAINDDYISNIWNTDIKGEISNYISNAGDEIYTSIASSAESSYSYIESKFSTYLTNFETSIENTIDSYYLSLRQYLESDCNKTGIKSEIFIAFFSGMLANFIAHELWDRKKGK